MIYHGHSGPVIDVSVALPSHTEFGALIEKGKRDLIDKSMALLAAESTLNQLYTYRLVRRLSCWLQAGARIVIHYSDGDMAGEVVDMEHKQITFRALTTKGHPAKSTRTIKAEWYKLVDLAPTK